jgi:hypothetical protein
MRGRRAPDLARGLLFDELDDIAGSVAVDLLGAFSPNLSSKERSVLVQDYEQGRAHLQFVLSLRLGHWEQHPWMLFGAACSDQDVARVCLQLCLTTPSDHPKVKYLHTELMEEAQSFIAGSTLQGLTLLHRFLAELRFVPTAERSIEGEHAQVPQFVKI